MDLGISDLERPSIDYVKYGELVYAHRSNYEGVVGMMIGLLAVFLCPMVFGGLTFYYSHKEIHEATLKRWKSIDGGVSGQSRSEKK